ncbi:MAG TPA: hypothetical protein VJ547_03860 [Candidatus Thermoplasmatota archaeon]|nr:hypothetical protein [Candidatus Thermoplasmatota archaeon]
MARRERLLAAALVAVLGGTALSGCISVFPVKGLLSTDPTTASQPFANVEVYHRAEEGPSGGGTCVAGSDVRQFYVPQRARSVSVDLRATLKAAPRPFDIVYNGSLDLVVKDGAGVVWVDVHEEGRSVEKKVVVEGPRPGAWAIQASWKLCDVSLVYKIHDSFEVSIIVNQPA